MIMEINLVCRKFNETCSKLLSRGFNKLDKRHATIYKRVKSALPRRESERKTHPLARHSDILQAVETRISMLNMTYTRYIENKLVCFIPGKVLDEMKSVLDLVESNRTPPRTHQLLQELRDLSSMAMEHFDEHILPKVKEQLEQRTGSPEKILKELEVVAGSLTPYSRFQDIICKNAASTSKASRIIFHQQMQQALTNEIHKVKKVTKTHKHHISYLTQNTHKLSLKLRKQTARIKAQSLKIREQERKIHEQNSKILEQEASLNDIKKHIDEWDQKYKDLTTELVRARDEIILKASATKNASLLIPHRTSAISSPSFKTNIKPRIAHILPKGYLGFEVERKRKSSQTPDIPLKRNRSPVDPEASSNKSFQKTDTHVQDVQLNIPDLVSFEKNDVASNQNDEVALNDERSIGIDKPDFVHCFLDFLTSATRTNEKARKRKMMEDIDLK